MSGSSICGSSLPAEIKAEEMKEGYLPWKFQVSKILEAL